MFKQWMMAGAILAVAAPTSAGAQDWRTLTTMRQHAGERALVVDVEYGAGTLDVQPLETGRLYRAELRYDAESFRPVNSYEDGRLTIGLEGRDRIKIRNREGAQLNLGLGPDVPLDLDLAFGAVEADLELGGLMVERAQIATGASETQLRFSRPNPIRANRIALEVGAASFAAYSLGNANAERIEVDGGVGDIVLDFTGEWRGDMDADIDVGVGSVTLRLPRGLGVRVDKESFLASFDSEGLIKRDDSYYSENWREAEHRLTVNIDAALGSIEIDWVNNDVEDGT